MPLLAGLRAIIPGVVLFLILTLGTAWQIEKRGHRKANERIVELVELRKADRANYEAAAKAAAEKNKATVARIESEQERVTHEIQSDYQRDLARLRGLLAQPKANRGSAGQPGAPANGKPSSGTDEASGVPLPPNEHVRAAENELQLDYLITWIEKQLGVKR